MGGGLLQLGNENDKNQAPNLYIYANEIQINFSQNNSSNLKNLNSSKFNDLQPV